MKKLAVFGLVAGALLAVILLVRKGQSSGSPRDREPAQQEKRRAMFDKMQAGMDALPDDFPPVVMFNNVAATRENSERILELLEKDRSGTEEPVVSAAKQKEPDQQRTGATGEGPKRDSTLRGPPEPIHSG